MAAGYSGTSSSGTGLCPGSSCVLRDSGPVTGIVGSTVAMLLSAVSCKWGIEAAAAAAGPAARAGVRNRQVLGPCGVGCARRPGGCCCGPPWPSGLQRPACPAARLTLGLVDLGVCWASCGGGDPIVVRRDRRVWTAGVGRFSHPW